MRGFVIAAAMVLGVGEGTLAAESESIAWSSSVEAAWRAAGSLDRPMIVFVTRAGCLPCARMKTATFVDRQVARLINERFVAVVVDGAQPTPLLNELRVHAVPATFVISSEAKILDRIEGFLPPQALAARLATFTPKPQSPTPPPAASARAF